MRDFLHFAITVRNDLSDFFKCIFLRVTQVKENIARAADILNFSVCTGNS